MKDLILRQLQESIETVGLLKDRCLPAIDQAARILIQALNNNNKVLLCGNGGSAADAQHIAAELIIRFRSDPPRRSLPALSLAADTSAITAAGNDLGFDQIFSRQVEGLGQPGDVLVGITTSGNSENVLQALLESRKKGMKTVLLTGGDGGRILKEFPHVVDAAICVPSRITARIQESHILIGHTLCAAIEEALFSFRSPQGKGS